MNKELDDLLPFYVNGSLDAQQRDAVEQYLSQAPAAAAQVRWYRSLQEQVRAEVPAVSSEVGLDRVLGRIRAEQPAPTPTSADTSASRWLPRLRGLIAGVLPQPVLRPALGAALAVVAGQAVWIAHLNNADETSQLRSAPGSAVAEQGPLLKVNFKSEAREADIRLLLVEVHGSLVGGPGQLGDWYVRVPAAEVDAAAARLKAALAIVDGVAVVDALPARN